MDATAKPNKTEKERIDKLITAVGGAHMTTEDIDILYRFRYSLTENKRALVKFLYSVNWEEESEVREWCERYSMIYKKCYILCTSRNT